jgi:hypothetical protein
VGRRTTVLLGHNPTWAKKKIPWYKVFFGALLDVASATKQYIAAKGLEVEVHACKKNKMVTSATCNID